LAPIPAQYGASHCGLLDARCTRHRLSIEISDVMADCVFCRILAGELPASIAYRDERCVVLMDIQPVNPGHLLVIPVRHGAHLADIDGETAAHLMRVGHRAAAALRESGVQCEGVNFFLADGEAAMQEVFHVHLHVFPRYRGDGFGLTFAPRYHTTRPERAELDALAQSLHQILTGRD
jgi:histidine triad (HIT) family protein